METIELTAIVDPLPGQELPFAASGALRAGLVMFFIATLAALLLAPRKKAKHLRLVHPLPSGRAATKAA
jgi:hypothetical protein